MSDKDEIREKVLTGVPTSCKGIVQSAREKKASPRAAIKANCLQCSGSVRDEVRNCQVVACALFEYRPYQTAGEQEGEQE